MEIEHLGLDPDALARKLKDWRAEGELKGLELTR